LPSVERLANLLHSGRGYASGSELRTPPVNQDRRTVGGLESLRVLQSLPWQLRERVAEDHSSPLLLAEAVLLAVGCVPDPVDEEICDVEEHQKVSVPAVDGRIMVRQIDGAVAVGQRDTGKVPENEHESPFLIVHVPETDQKKANYGATAEFDAYQVETIHSSPFEQALAYRKCANRRKPTSPET